MLLWGLSALPTYMYYIGVCVCVAVYCCCCCGLSRQISEMYVPCAYYPTLAHKSLIKNCSVFMGQSEFA